MCKYVEVTGLLVHHQREEFALNSKNFSFSCERDLILFALCCLRQQGRGLQGWLSSIQPQSPQSEYFASIDVFGIMSEHMSVILERGEILCTTFLITETSIV